MWRETDLAKTDLDKTNLDKTSSNKSLDIGSLNVLCDKSFMEDLKVTRAQSMNVLDSPGEEKKKFEVRVTFGKLTPSTS